MFEASDSLVGEHFRIQLLIVEAFAARQLKGLTMIRQSLMRNLQRAASVGRTKQE